MTRTPKSAGNSNELSLAKLHRLGAFELSIGGVALAAAASCSTPAGTGGDLGGGGVAPTGTAVTTGGGVGATTGAPGAGGGAVPGGAGMTTTGVPAGTGGNPGTGTGAGGASGGAGAVPGGGGTTTSGGGMGTGGNLPGGGMGNTAGTGAAGAPASSEPTNRPSLITSGEGAYWTLGEVTPGGTAATFSVDSGQEYQQWHGWGGTFNEAGWTALGALTPEKRDEAINLLFSVEDGLGLDWGRIPMGPSDYANARYTLSDAPGQFSIDHDVETLIPYVKAAQLVKGDVKYWASPWTPPPWAKMGNTENGGYDKGLFDPQHYSAYADFFVSWIQAYEAQGIPIDHVMPQNEPGWAQAYPTCAWGPAYDSSNRANDIPNTEPVTLGTFVDQHLFRALDDAGLTTDVWFGTLSNDETFDFYWSDMTSKPSWSRIVGVGLQWETINSMSTVGASGKLVMQSEHRCGNYPWLEDNPNPPATSPADANRDNFLPGMAPNNHAYGQESWDLIKAWIETDVHIYSAWNMVLDTGGFNLDMSRPWPQNALLAVDTGSGELQVTAYYYVFRHVAQYVAVGAKRIGVTGNALAFKNPDGSIVTIMYNDGGSPSQATLSVDGTMVQFTIPAGGWATVNTPAG